MPFDYCQLAIADLLPASMDRERLPPLRGKTLGARITESYKNLGMSRAEFHRALQAADPSLRDLAYPTIMTWERTKKPKVPQMRTVATIARVTGYTIDELSRDPVPSDDGDTSGPMTPEQASDLLSKLGAPERLQAAVMGDLTAYPPRGGLTRDEVVRVHRLLQKAVAINPEPPEHAELDEQLKRAGVRPTTAEQLKDHVDEEHQKQRPPTANTRPRRRRA